VRLVSVTFLSDAKNMLHQWLETTTGSLRCRRWLLSLRGALGCCSVTALFFATQQLPIADATVFSFLAPVIVAALSPLLLQESSRGVWVSIAGCSIGVLLVAQPGMMFGETRLTVFGVCLGILHSTASGTAKVLQNPLL
jgi:drug/metabolite transporter (DMT)-like permease